MTGHKRIPTKAPLISERRFISLCEVASFGVLFCLGLYALAVLFGVQA